MLFKGSCDKIDIAAIIDRIKKEYQKNGATGHIEVKITKCGGKSTMETLAFLAAADNSNSLDYTVSSTDAATLTTAEKKVEADKSLVGTSVGGVTVEGVQKAGGSHVMVSLALLSVSVIFGFAFGL